MALTTTVVGSYPKPPEEGKQFVLRKTLHAVERGDASADDIKAAQDDLVREIITEQQDAGIELVTDGHARWDDILTPFARHIGGFEIGGLLRWFDNNVYYRRPVCVGDIEWRGPSSVESFKFASSVASAEVKAIIPGPLTFAKLSVDEHYGSDREFTLALARVLAQEAFELEAAGAKIIQIDEPALLGAPEDLALAREAVGIVVGELGKSQTILATYFGDAKRLGADLFDFPVDGFGLDFVSGPANFELLDAFPEGKRLQAGIVDARNTKLETEDDLKNTIERLTSAVDADRLLISPSSGLEFLPREKARAKLQRIGDIAGKVGA
jgi:5-methyltetrahydropteroyltriglutamate--homocysteine methyltransferase